MFLRPGWLWMRLECGSTSNSQFDWHVSQVFFRGVLSLLDKDKQNRLCTGSCVTWLVVVYPQVDQLALLRSPGLGPILHLLLLCVPLDQWFSRYQRRQGWKGRFLGLQYCVTLCRPAPWHCALAWNFLPQPFLGFQTVLSKLGGGYC